MCGPIWVWRVLARDIRIFWYAVSVKGCKKLTSVNLQAHESIRRWCAVGCIKTKHELVTRHRPYHRLRATECSAWITPWWWPESMTVRVRQLTGKRGAKQQRQNTRGKIPQKYIHIILDFKLSPCFESCILLGISPASDCGLPTFRNPLSVPSSWAGCKVWSILYIQPLKMEVIEGSETSANHNRTPGKYPKEYIQKNCDDICLEKSGYR